MFITLATLQICRKTFQQMRDAVVAKGSAEYTSLSHVGRIETGH